MQGSPRKIKKTRVSFGPPFSGLSNLEKGAETIVCHCLTALSAESASFFIGQEDGKTLQLIKAIGPRANNHVGKCIKLGEGVSGYVAAIKEPLLVPDLSREKRLTLRKDRVPVDTFMSCPVVKDSSVLAVLNIAGRKEGRPFSKTDLRKLQKIAAGYSEALSKLIARQRSFTLRAGPVGEAERPHAGLESIEKHLQELQNYNASILQWLSEYVLIFDDRLNIIHCNKEDDFIQLFDGGKGAQIKGRNVLRDLSFDVDREELRRRLENMMAHRDPFSLKDVKVKDSPDSRVVNMFFSPFHSTQGRVLGGLLLLEDNTKNYQTRQLLEEAQKLSLMGSLTSMITHEVNNPLDGVMRLINISMAQTDQEDPIWEYLSGAQKGLQQIASLVRSLLSFSRKSVSLDGESAPLNKIIENTASMVRSGIRGKDISYTLNLASENPTVRTNDFYQIISNLLSNSTDAVTTERGSVNVETGIDDDNLHIIVEDNGCGIPEHVRARMFEAFVTTKEYGKGTGLGLAIVKKVVDKYGGIITVESRENAGTKMHLILPMSKLTP